MIRTDCLALGTLVENPAQLSPRPPLMKRMCSGRPGHECGLVIGWVVCMPHQAGAVTHTVCPACTALWREELASLCNPPGTPPGPIPAAPPRPL